MNESNSLLLYVHHMAMSSIAVGVARTVLKYPYSVQELIPSCSDLGGRWHVKPIMIQHGVQCTIVPKLVLPVTGLVGLDY